MPATDAPPGARPVTVRSMDPLHRLRKGEVARALRVLDSHHGALSTAHSALANRHGLSAAFLTAPALSLLHGRFLADPSTTDVITFAGDPALGLAGEICVSAGAAARFAEKNGLDFSEELTLYLVHGWLHLAGHDDLEPSRRRAMRRAEARAIRILRSAGAIPRFGRSGAGRS